MMNIIWILIPCLALALIIVIIEMCSPAVSRNKLMDVTKQKAKVKYAVEHQMSLKTISYLRHPKYLIAFRELLVETDDDSYKNILTANSKAITKMIVNQRDNVLCGYFAYMLQALDLTKLEVNVREDYFALMFSLLTRKSIFTRENALEVIYKFGITEYVIKAYKFMSENNIGHSFKLLSDGLQTFTGKMGELAFALIQNKKYFLIQYQIATVNFLSYSEIHNFDPMLACELNEILNLDYACSVLRLIGKVKSEENKKFLLSMIEENGGTDRWQPAAVAVNGLIHYKNDVEVMNELVKSCCSKSWSVRINSAHVLAEIDDTNIFVKKVLACNDRYAVDAISYALTSKAERSAK